MKTGANPLLQNRLLMSVLVGFFVFVSVLLTVVLFKNISANRPLRQNREVLVAKIKELEKERAELKKRISELSEKLEKLESQAASVDERVEEIKKELDRLRVKAGFTEVTGRGLEIILKDADVKVVGAQAEQAIVHDSDLRLVVNGLFLGGAKAVSINGERLIAISSIRCVGPTILINNKRVSSPFIIKAVGDPDSLIAGLYREATLKHYIENVFPELGIGFQVTRKERVSVPAYSGSASLLLESVRVVER